jgi:hypothetical protein
MTHNRRFRYQPCNYNAAGKVGIYCKVSQQAVEGAVRCHDACWCRGAAARAAAAIGWAQGVASLTIVSSTGVDHCGISTGANAAAAGVESCHGLKVKFDSCLLVL